MLALSVLGLLPGSARVTGSVRLDGTEILASTPAQWQGIRGTRVAMVFQDPMTALNPMYTVGWQVAECVRLHRRVSKAAAWQRAVEVLGLVGLPEPAQLARRFPHELSGGMRQRVVIAIAIANEPDLLIADEPTTALDVTVQAQILDTLRSIRQETGAALILISHDLGVVAGVADQVLVMYAGKAVEVGRADDVFADPRMPYTAGLLASLPDLDQRSERLASIGGSPPSGTGYGPGCAFAPRCPAAAPACARQPELVTVGAGHVAACHFAARPDDGTGAPAMNWGQARAAARRPPAAAAAAAPADADGDVILSARNLVKHFRVRGTRFRSVATVQALSGVDLDLRAGRCLALVGESGCGKSTLARLLLRLEDPTSGSITLNGRELTGLGDAQLRPIRPQIQMVFQDPYSSLNPRLSVGEIVGEPLTVHHDRRQGPAGPRAAGQRRPRPGRRGALPRRVLRRPAAADRHRARPGPGAADPGPGRAGVGARRQHPGQRAQPAARPAAQPQHGLPVHRPRPGRGAPGGRRGGRDVPRPDRRAGPGRRDLPAARAPLHDRAAVRRADPGPAARAQPRSASCCAARSPARWTRRRAAGSAPAAGKPTTAAPAKSRRCGTCRAATGWPATTRRTARWDEQNTKRSDPA